MLKVLSIKQELGWREPSSLFPEPPLCETRLVRAWCEAEVQSLLMGSRTRYTKIWHLGIWNIFFLNKE